MASGEGNFPVPKIRRDPKVRPAMTSGLFENDMTDNLENYADLSRHEQMDDLPGDSLITA
jgi:hypothetical protein